MIPTYEQIMLPFLEYLSDNKIHSLNDTHEHLCQKFQLTDSEIRELLPSGRQAIFRNRIGWARTYLKKAGLLDSPKRAHFKITQRGLELLNEKLNEINGAILKRYPEFIEFQSFSKEKNDYSQKPTLLEEEITPEESLEYAFQNLKTELAKELLEKLKIIDPFYFEKVILILLNKMGYGDFIETSKTGDGGIDGIINEDKLGLDKIYIQAKRYGDNKVREKDIRNFIGAMSGDTQKGVFVTTSDFDVGAIKKAENAHHTIILVNGLKLVDLMQQYNVGIQIKTTYEVKELDHDFFEDV